MRVRPASLRGTARAPSASRSDGSRRRRAARPSAGDAPRLAVDVHPPAAGEATERDAAVAGEIDGEHDGAPTATTIGQPATAAFWTSSNERRPLTQSTQRASGSEPSQECPADDLVHRVVAADVLAQAEQFPVERRRGRSRAGRLSQRTPVAPCAGDPAARRAALDRHRRSASTRRASTATASSAPLPQTPHEELV